MDKHDHSREIKLNERTPCPACGRLFGYVMQYDNTAAAPRPGDIVLCPECLQFSICRGFGRFDRMSQEEFNNQRRDVQIDLIELRSRKYVTRERIRHGGNYQEQQWEPTT